MFAIKLLPALSRKVFQANSRQFMKSLRADLQLERRTIGEQIFNYCDKYSSKTAIIDDVRKINYSYGDFKNAINAIASALTKKGVKPGMMAGIIATNSPEYIMIAYALSSMGCTVTVCNQNYTENELMYQLGDSQPSILFTDNELLSKVSKTASQLPCVKNIYLIGCQISGYESVDSLLKDSGNMSPIGQLDLDLNNQIALLPYSSGTTGLSKGVMLSHLSLIAAHQQMSAVHAEEKSGNFLLILPLYHIYAIAITLGMVFKSGSTLVVQPKFQPNQFLTAIDQHKISVLHIVPPIVLFLINHPMVKNFKLETVEKIVCGAAPLDRLIEEKLIAKFKATQADFDIYQGYGLTETSGSALIIPNGQRVQGKHGSAGMLVPNLECKVVDPDTRQEVSANETGELLFRGPNIMKGYFGKSSASEKAFENDWFKTGDIGYYDKDNYFFIKDRIKDLIKVKALQVTPTELEITLLSMPGIIDCAVIGVPDERDGEVPRAFIVKNTDIQEKEIHEFMEKNLSSHKQLKGGIYFVNEIPKSPSGKILRNALRSR